MHARVLVFFMLLLFVLQGCGGAYTGRFLAEAAWEER